MHIFQWLARMLHNRTDVSMFDQHIRSINDLSAECRSFMEKGSFIELNFSSAEGKVKENEAHTGSYKGGAEVSAG